jgi:hypothetical protein
MSTLATNTLTLADWAKRIDPQGKLDVSAIIEVLDQTNEVLTDMQWKPGNLPTGHRTVVRTGLPTVAWRLLNQGVPVTKTRTAQIDEACGQMADYSEVDVSLAKLNGEEANFRLSEAVGKLEAMNQEFASTLFYGNSSISPEEFTGLSIRYSSLSANNARNIINCSGSGSDQTSIWLIVWGDKSIHGIFPKGSQAGIVHKNLGEVTVENAAGVTGNRMQAYRDYFEWNCGIALKDWRYVARIANIDVPNLTTESSAANIIKAMIKSTYRIQSLKMGRPAFYMNRTVAQMLDIQRFNTVAAAGMTMSEVDGVQKMAFRGIPVRICDAILDTETAIS